MTLRDIESSCKHRLYGLPSVWGSVTIASIACPSGSNLKPQKVANTPPSLTIASRVLSGQEPLPTSDPSLSCLCTHLAKDGSSSTDDRYNGRLEEYLSVIKNGG